MTDDLKSIFGDWIKRPTSWFTVTIGLALSIASAIQVAKNFGDPIIRWVALLFILVLCLGGLFIQDPSTQSVILGADEKPLKSRDRTRVVKFGFGAVMAAVFLSVDLITNLTSLTSSLEYDGPTYTGGVSAVFPIAEGRRLVRIPIRTIEPSYKSNNNKPSYVGEDPGAFPSVNYKLRKPDRIKELVLKDATLTVHKYEKEPSIYYMVSPFEPVDELIIAFDIGHREGPLPWKFKPNWIRVNDKIKDWRPDLVSTKDGFTTQLKLAVHSNDPGIYTFDVKLEFVSDFSKHTTYTFPDNPTSFLFTSDQKPRFPVDGERIITIKPGGDSVESLYKSPPSNK